MESMTKDIVQTQINSSFYLFRISLLVNSYYYFPGTYLAYAYYPFLIFFVIYIEDSSISKSV